MDKMKITILTLLLVCGRLIGQIDNSDKLLIKINQRILPGPNPDILYEVKNGQITIYEIEIWNSDKLIKKKKIYRDRLNPDFIDTLILKINNSKIDDLDDKYSGGYIDGVWWTVKVNTDKIKKEIFLDNYYVPEIGQIVDLINDNLPKKHRIIRFDYLGIKDRYTDD